MVDRDAANAGKKPSDTRSIPSKGLVANKRLSTLVVQHIDRFPSGRVGKTRWGLCEAAVRIGNQGKL
jgi:hypothetical protein